MSEYVRKPLKEWHEIIAEKDTEIDRLTAENERLRQVLENVQQARVLQGKSITDASNEIERLRAALESIADLPPGYADMRQDDLVVILASKARAACLAMLAAWPGILPKLDGRYLIIPLPQENTNAES